MYTQDTALLGNGSRSVASAKQASVLFGEVLFETRWGVAEDLPWDEAHERYAWSKASVARARRKEPISEVAHLIRWVDADEKIALEARGVRLIGDASTSEFFVDDPEAPPSGHGFFNGLPHLLQRKGCDWVREVVVNPSTLPDRTGGPDEVAWLGRTRAIAQAHEAALYGGEGDRSPLGAPVLALFVPNLVAVPWEAIAEFRAHPGSREARHRLLDIDARAQLGQVTGDDIADFEHHVGREITRCLLGAWADTRPKMGRNVAKEAVTTGVGFIPLAGSAIAAAASISESAMNLRHHDRSWLSALWNLANSADST
jgi:hypothetical protein